MGDEVIPIGGTIVDDTIPYICSTCSLSVQNEEVSNHLGFSRSVQVHGIYNGYINSKIKSIKGGLFFSGEVYPRSYPGATVGRTE